MLRTVQRYIHITYVYIFVKRLFHEVMGINIYISTVQKKQIRLLLYVIIHHR